MSVCFKKHPQHHSDGANADGIPSEGSTTLRSFSILDFQFTIVESILVVIPVFQNTLIIVDCSLKIALPATLIQPLRYAPCRH